MESLSVEIEEEYCEFDQSVNMFLSDTLDSCNKILANPKQFSKLLLRDAQVTKEQLIKYKLGL